MSDPRYKVGDAVTLVNDQGVHFYGKRIKEVVRATTLQPGMEPRYYIEPTDTPWYTFGESQLRPDGLAEPAPQGWGTW